MDNPVADAFEEEYAQIKDLVTAAREAQDAEHFKQAKSLFLDAASKTLALSKTLEDSEQITFQNIARILVDNAKEMQLLREMQDNPLPSIPGKTDVNKRMSASVEIPSKTQATLLQLMIIQKSGVPVYHYTSSKLTEEVQLKINDILFSGAITAVNSLISEVLNKPIQAIKVDAGHILLNFADNLTFVVFSKGDPETLEKPISKFSTEFCGEFLPRLESDIRQGKSLTDRPEINQLVETHFTNL